MKISGSKPPVLIDMAQTIAENDAAQQNEVKTAADRVEISSKAREISWAVDQIKKMPKVDLVKVAKIKVMLENGTYRVDSPKIAAKMIEEALLSDQ